MRERIAQARQLGARMEERWRGDADAQLARLYQRRKRRNRQRALAGATAAIAVALVVGRAVWPAPVIAVVPPVTATEVATIAAPARVAPLEVPASEPEPGMVQGADPDAHALALGDGSVVRPVGDSKLMARRVGADEVVVALGRGAAALDVPLQPKRLFVAELGALRVETRGAAFHVRVSPRQIEVSADRGQVVVRGSRVLRVVAAHETHVFELEAPAAPSSPREPAAVAPASVSTWRDDAQRGDYAAAWRALAEALPSDASMADLLLAGDVARLSGHPTAAIAWLHRAVEAHASDPRSPLAAFTLGRVQLEELGAPRDAALAFARARALAPSGPLAEDALAREVEAWSRAGEAASARARADEYTQRYPDGRRVRAVRRFGGLETP